MLSSSHCSIDTNSSMNCTLLVRSAVRESLNYYCGEACARKSAGRGLACVLNELLGRFLLFPSRTCGCIISWWFSRETSVCCTYQFRELTIPAVVPNFASASPSWWDQGTLVEKNSSIIVLPNWHVPQKVSRLSRLWYDFFTSYLSHAYDALFPFFFACSKAKAEGYHMASGVKFSCADALLRAALDQERLEKIEAHIHEHQHVLHGLRFSEPKKSKPNFSLSRMMYLRS